MRKLMVLIVGFGMLATASAHAAETTGTVRGVNKKSDAITLSDGKVYVLPEGIEAESVKVGQRVKIEFSQRKGKNRASSLVNLK